MMTHYVELDMDCAQIFALKAAAMSRGSEHSQDVCSLCAAICQSSGDECAKHQMACCQQCAKACLKRADECRKMEAS